MESIHFQQVYKEIIQLQIRIKRTEATQLTEYKKIESHHAEEYQKKYFQTKSYC